MKYDPAALKLAEQSSIFSDSLVVYDAHRPIEEIVALLKQRAPHLVVRDPAQALQDSVRDFSRRFKIKPQPPAEADD